jgi:RND family efflux transporter MFP subunit
MTSRSHLSRLCAAALLAGLAGCAEEKQAAPPPPLRPVLVQDVKFEPRLAPRTFVGTVRARTETDLGFRIAGKIAQRHVQVGDRVRSGQALATLDASDAQLQVEQAQAEVAAATASLSQAEAEDRRLTTLRGEGWSTASAFDRQKAATAEARSRLARAERTLALASNTLAYTTLYADGEGVVTATTIEPGQVVAAGQIAVRVARLDAREAVVSIPEALIERARSGKASVSLWSEPGVTYQAKLREFSPAADPATRTYQARFTILDAPHSMELGLSATVTVTARDGEKVARLPLSALFNQGSGPSVFVVNADSGDLTLRPVTVLAYESRDVLITAGLNEGEAVVTLGVQKLDVTQRVRVVRADG